ncbi:MAG: filamentous hemagglutinin N-terminal domain-containing protein, partial [Candidatus Omnitrophica bacterium]|nr:filamentous hemagglutinin N-terminal domain-containing protein [Candidatus Omnitrophota bacterium]
MGTRTQLKKNLVHVPIFFIALAFLFSVDPAFGLPEGAQFDPNEVSISQPNATTMEITASDKAVVSFNSFNISENEQVRFIQPNLNASVLSRVTGNSQTQIFGSLSANGILVFINPNGIYFGPTANVQANVFIASTLDINTNNFKNSNYLFEHKENSPYSQIQNEGKISTNNTALIASAVSNSGTIEAKAGTVHLVSGDKATVSFDRMGLIQVEVNEATSGEVKDANGVTIKDAVSNSGTIEAAQVTMTADTAKDIFKNAVNQTGIVRANQVVEVDHVIRIIASGANAQVSGILDPGAKGSVLIFSSESIDIGFKLSMTGHSVLAANKDINVNADITNDSGGLELLADSDLDGKGSFHQAAGTWITTTNFGDITIQASGESTLANIDSAGDLILKAGGAPPTFTQQPNSIVNTKGSVIIGRGVTLKGASTLYNIEKDWINAGAFHPQISTLNMTSDNDSKVTGDNTFYNFTVIEPGKAIKFDTPSPVIIINNLLLKGCFGMLLSLTSLDPSRQWSIHPLGETDIQFTLISNAINVRGPPLKAIHSSSLGNNTNFDLDPYWVGAGSNSNWSTGANWDTGTAPTAADAVTFDGTAHGVPSASPNKDAYLDASFQGTVASLTVNGYSGTITLLKDLTITGNLDVTSGTLAGSANVTVAGGSATGNGIINLTNGSNFLLKGTGNFGGATDWTFFNLTFGDGIASGTTSKSGNNTVTATNQLTISLNQSLNAGSGTWNLVWNTNYLTGIIAIAAGYTHSLALKSDGTVWAWGSNTNGELGTGYSGGYSFTPVQVIGVGGVGFLSSITAISSTGYHNLALKSDGTVYSWGYNDKGQLGIGTSDANAHNTPVQVLGVGGTGYLTNITAISGGYKHNVVLKSDGTVYSWGYNSYDELGDGTTTDRYTPVQVLGVGATGYLTGITFIAAGAFEAAAIRGSDGAVFTWGYNANGECGDGTTSQRSSPVQVLGVGGTGYLTDITSIAVVGNSNTVIGTMIALKNDGTVYSWGRNGYGELGVGTTDNSAHSTPVQTLGGATGTTYLSGVTAVYAGSYNVLAIKSDGTVWSWGYNNVGQLGNGNKADNYTPVQVQGPNGVGYLTGVTQLASSDFYTNTHSMALKSDGTVYAWGDNSKGQLGTGNTLNSAVPVEVVGAGGNNNVQYLSNIIAIAAGYSHTLALKSDGTLYTWGDNSKGEIGDNTTTQRNIPVQVLGVGGIGYLTGITAIAAGNYFSLAVGSSGTVYAWGSNSNGQLGDNSITQRNTPVQVLDVGGSGYLSGVTAVSAGGYFSLALKNDGTVYTWGGNDRGQLGNNTTTEYHYPLQVLGVAGTGYLSGITAIDAGYYNSLALKNDGTVYAWGYNSYGQLGDNTTTQRNTPVQVLGVGGIGYLTNITAVSQGMYHSLALKSDGTVYAWGDGASGKLGVGTTAQSNVPVQVLGVGGTGYLTGISWITGTNSSSFAVASNGAVYAWGSNTNSTIGDGTTTQRTTPVQVLAPNATGYLSGITIIARGSNSNQSFALSSSGTVYAWGFNGQGCLGDNTLTTRSMPQLVLAPAGTGSNPNYLTGITAIAAGSSTFLALRGTDGAVFTWSGTTAPMQVPGVGGVGYLTGISAISAGSSGDYLALKSDGTVYDWGVNTYGQLGNNTTIDSLFPVQVLGVGGLGYLTGIIAIDAGASHNLALRNDGTVYSWGYNTSGQLGINNTTNSSTPVQVLGVGGTGYLTGIIAVAAADGSGGNANHSLALRSDGTVYAWGRNSEGQLGDSTTSQRNTPIQVLGVGGVGYLTGVSAIAAGYTHSLALRSDGTVCSWGDNTNGKLGDNTTSQRNSPVQVYGVSGTGYLSGITGISAGSGFSIALKSDGTVYAWGLNTSGQLGDGTVTQRLIPVQVLGVAGSGYLSGVTTINASGTSSMALKSDGTVYTWGSGGYLTTNGTTAPTAAYPVQVVNASSASMISLTGIIAISASETGHTLALKGDGTVYAWGANGSGQLGDNTTTDRYTPVQVVGVGGVGYLTGITAIAAGNAFSLALRSDGTVYGWGFGTSGQLGYNSSTSISTPVQVLGVGATGYLSGITAISAGTSLSVALKFDGTVYAWGDNTSGKIGDNTTTQRNTPVQVLGVGGAGYLTGITAIDTGSQSTLALKSDGTVVAWGANSSGQLGDGTSTSRSTPVQTLGVGGAGYLSGIIAISGGTNGHSLALKSDGTVYA